jgi:hypothetical protein
MRTRIARIIYVKNFMERNFSRDERKKSFMLGILILTPVSVFWTSVQGFFICFLFLFFVQLCEFALCQRRHYSYLPPLFTTSLSLLDGLIITAHTGTFNKTSLNVKGWVWTQTAMSKIRGRCNINDMYCTRWRGTQRLCVFDVHSQDRGSDLCHSGPLPSVRPLTFTLLRLQ